MAHPLHFPSVVPPHFSAILLHICVQPRPWSVGLVTTPYSFSKNFASEDRDEKEAAQVLELHLGPPGPGVLESWESDLEGEVRGLQLEVPWEPSDSCPHMEKRRHNEIL